MCELSSNNAQLHPSTVIIIHNSIYSTGFDTILSFEARSNLNYQMSIASSP